MSRSMSSSNTTDTEQLLWDMNNEKARLFIPATLYVGTMMIVGIMGNCMVAYFYGYKSKTSPSTSFILALSIFDLVTCLVGMPMEIADLRFYYNFKSEAACKILRFVTYFASISSCLALVLIAIDRHRRICRPLTKQLSDYHVKVMCFVIGVSSALLSWPAIVFNKVVKMDLRTDANVAIQGHLCTTTREDSWKLFFLITNVVYFFGFIVIALVLGILYCLISRQLLKHKKFRFYLAKKSATRHKISVQALNNSDEYLLPRETSSVFADPPDATGSVEDLRELVTHGLPAVEHDRPLSGFTVVTRTTGATGLTDISGKSKRSTHSLKNVTIGSPSHNQVFHIESRDDARRQTDDEIETGWADYNPRRPGSASSFASFSSRPSSATVSSFGDESRRRPVKMFHDDDDSDENDELQEQNEENNTASNENSINITDVKDDQSNEKNELYNITDIFPSNTTGTDNTVNVERKTCLQREKSPNSSLFFESVYTKAQVEYAGTMIEDLEENNEVMDSTDNEEKETDAQERPASVGSNSTKLSKVSSRSSWSQRRSNVVTPSSNVTITSSVASRASSIRRLKRLFSSAFNTGKSPTDTDNVKELRLKMLDINTVKYTMIMLVITVVFVVSFLPYLSLVIWRYYKDEHEADIMSDTELVLFQIGVRSIFLNSALNPVIYGGFNSKFRAFFYSIFCRCCIRQTRKRKIAKARDNSSSTS